MKLILWMIWAFAIFTVVRIVWTFHLFDFAIYYQAVRDLQHSISMYQDPSIAMKYPMSAMVILAPIAWMPYVVAEKLWTVLSLLAMAGSLWMMVKILPQVTKREWSWIVALIVLSFPYKFTLGMGQINFVILACLVGSLYGYLRKSDGWAGILLAIAAWIKITPLVLLLFYLKKRKYKTIVVALATYLAGWVMAGEIWGYALVKEFVFEVIPSISTLGNEVYYNQALTGLLARLGVGDNIAGIINYLSLAVMLGMGYIVTPRDRREPKLELLSFGMLVTAMILGSGLAWQHYFVWLLIPYLGAYAVWSEQRETKVWMGVALAISYVLVALNIKNPADCQFWHGVALSHVTYGTLILGVVGYVLARKAQVYK